jgi:hypothetical protein
MIILIPLIAIVVTFYTLKWLFLHLQLQARLAFASAGAGVGGYSLVGWLAPHSDPHSWHFATGIALAVSVFAISKALFLARA